MEPQTGESVPVSCLSRPFDNISANKPSYLEFANPGVSNDGSVLTSAAAREVRKCVVLQAVVSDRFVLYFV